MMNVNRIESKWMAILTFGFEVTLLAAKSQWAEKGQTTNGDEGNSNGSSGDTCAAQTSIRDGRLD